MISVLVSLIAFCMANIVVCGCSSSDTPVRISNHSKATVDVSVESGRPCSVPSQGVKTIYVKMPASILLTTGKQVEKFLLAADGEDIPAISCDYDIDVDEDGHSNLTGTMHILNKGSRAKNYGPAGQGGTSHMVRRWYVLIQSNEDGPSLRVTNLMSGEITTIPPGVAASFKFGIRPQ